MKRSPKSRQEVPIAQVDHYQWRMILCVLGEYPWHQHDERDDCFLRVLRMLGGNCLMVVQVVREKISLLPWRSTPDPFSVDRGGVLLFEPIA